MEGVEFRWLKWLETLETKTILVECFVGWKDVLNGGEKMFGNSIPSFCIKQVFLWDASNSFWRHA